MSDIDDEFGLFADSDYVRENEGQSAGKSDFESLESRIDALIHDHIDPETGKCRCDYCVRPVRERRVPVVRVSTVQELPTGDRVAWGFAYLDPATGSASQDVLTFFPTRDAREEYVDQLVKLGFTSEDSLFLSATMLAAVLDHVVVGFLRGDVADTIEQYNSSELSVECFEEPPVVENYVDSFAGLMLLFAQETVQKHDPKLWAFLSGEDLDD